MLSYITFSYVALRYVTLQLRDEDGVGYAHVCEEDLDILQQQTQGKIFRPY